jgi:hypothetical protein
MMDPRNLNDETPKSLEQSHHSVRTLFPEYATETALRGAPPDAGSALRAHLAECAACRAELDELIDLTTAAYAGQIARAPYYPRADLSFLPWPEPAPARVRPWLLDELGRLVIGFSEALLAALAPRATAGAPRGQFLFRYVQEPGSVHDLEVTIDVFAEDAARTLGRVRIGVDVPSRGAFDQSGSQVVVRAGETILQGETDETGSVDLAPIPLDVVQRMRVEITPSRE